MCYQIFLSNLQFYSFLLWTTRSTGVLVASSYIDGDRITKPMMNMNMSIPNNEPPNGTKDGRTNASIIPGIAPILSDCQPKYLVAPTA